MVNFGPKKENLSLYSRQDGMNQKSSHATVPLKYTQAK